MRSVDKLLDFSKQYNPYFGAGMQFTKRNTISPLYTGGIEEAKKRYIHLLNNLRENEEVFFTVFSNIWWKWIHSEKIAMGPLVLAITNERMIVCSSGGTRFNTEVLCDSYDLNSVVSVSAKQVLFGRGAFTVKIETKGNDDIEILFDETCSKNTISDLSKNIDICKKNSVQPKVGLQQLSPADEILKFKGLLDAGIITQEEFDAKKKQLLGL